MSQLGHLITRGKSVLKLVITNVRGIEAHVQPYLKEKDVDVLLNWSTNTETRLKQIEDSSILNIMAPKNDFWDSFRQDRRKFDKLGFQNAVKRTILAIKAAAGALTEAQMAGCFSEIPKIIYQNLPPLQLKNKPPFAVECRRSYDLHKHELKLVTDSMEKFFHQTATNLKKENLNGNGNWDTANIIIQAQNGALDAMIVAHKHYCALPENISLSLDVKLEKHLNYYIKILMEIRNNFMMELNAVCTHFSLYVFCYCSRFNRK